mgnify:CR=1 FL=1
MIDYVFIGILHDYMVLMHFAGLLGIGQSLHSLQHILVDDVDFSDIVFSLLNYNDIG